MSAKTARKARKQAQKRQGIERLYSTYDSVQLGDRLRMRMHFINFRTEGQKEYPLLNNGAGLDLAFVDAFESCYRMQGDDPHGLYSSLPADFSPEAAETVYFILRATVYTAATPEQIAKVAGVHPMTVLQVVAANFDFPGISASGFRCSLKSTYVGVAKKLQELTR